MMKKQRKREKTTFESEKTASGLGALLRDAGFSESAGSGAGEAAGDGGAPIPSDSAPRIPGDYRVRTERKGRAGKIVTVLSGLSMPAASTAALAARMKRSLGCGASVVDGCIVFQGDLAARIRQWIDSRQ